MFSKFDDNAKKVLVQMQKEMMELKHPYIGSEHLFLSLLKYGNSADLERLKKYGITYDCFRKELIRIVGIGKTSNEFYLYTPLLKNILESAALTAGDRGKDSIDCTDLLLAIFEEGEGVAIRILIGMNIDIDELYDDFTLFLSKHTQNTKLMVDNFGVDLNKKALNHELDPVYGRDKEIIRLLEILSRRTKNNPLLIGDAGVGKTALVEELARRIVEGNVSFSLKNKRIVSVSMASLVAGTKYRGEFEDRISKMIQELEENDEVILFIDEIHTLVGAGGAEGAIDASNILKPALARGKIKLIGATTTSEYKEFIEKDKALARRFQPIEVLEPNLDVSLDILKKLKPIYESFHHVKIREDILKSIISLSDRYIYDRKMPDKAIDVLDEVCSKVSIAHFQKDNSAQNIEEEILLVQDKKNHAIMDNNFKDAFSYRQEEMRLESLKNEKHFKECISSDCYSVTYKDVKDVIFSRSKIPVLEFEKDTIIKQLARHLKSHVFGQEEVIEKLCEITKRLRYGYSSLKPTSFLFVGPTGVGKTLLAKEYAKFCYGEDHFIRIDMSEFKEAHSISKLIGSPPGYVGYDEHKNIFEEVRDHPYSVILLDEIEKAHPDILPLFLQILDEGRCKNAKGETIHFEHTVIIMTSNLGYSNHAVGFCSREEIAKEEQLKNFLGIEFLNRISKILYFSSMKEEIVLKILKHQISLLKERYMEKDFSVSISKNVLLKLANLCEYEKYGARKVEKVIMEYLETRIIDSMLHGEHELRFSNASL